MPIQQQPVDFSGLVALAGRGVPNLGLKPVSYDIGAPYRGMFEGALEAAKLANANRNTDLQAQMVQDKITDNQQRALFNAEQKQQEAAILREHELNKLMLSSQLQSERDQQISPYQQGQLAIQAGQLDLNKEQLGYNKEKDAKKDDREEREFQAERQDKELDRMATMTKEKRERLGGLGAVLVSAAQEDPENFNAISKVALDVAKSNGDIDDKQYAELSKMDAKQLYQTGFAITGLASAGGRLAKERRSVGASKMGAAAGKFLDHDLEKVGKMEEQATAANDVLSLVTSARETLANIPNWKINPIAGIRNANMLSEDVQKLKSAQAGLTAMARQVLKFPAAGFSEGDRQSLETFVSSPSSYKGTIEQAFNMLENLSQKAIKNAYNANDTLRKTHLSKEEYSQWKEANPEPMFEQKYSGQQEAQIKAAMQANNMSREQVIQEAKKRGLL